MWILKSTCWCHFLLQNKKMMSSCTLVMLQWDWIPLVKMFRLYKIYDDSANHNSQTKLFYVTVIKTYTIALGELGTTQITRGQMFLFLRFSTSCLFSGSRQCVPWKIQIKQQKSYHSMEGHEKQKKYDRELEGCMIRKPTAHGINSAQLDIWCFTHKSSSLVPRPYPAFRRLE